jgi:hypothetical protein
MTENEQRKYLTLAGIGVGLYIIVSSRNAVQAAKNIVTEDLNPASDQNLINRTFDSVTQTVTGNPNFTLGGWIYDITHKDQKP